MGWVEPYSIWIAPPEITNCLFKNNTASNGGGIFNNASSPSLLNCTIEDNIVSNRGGGVCNIHNSNPDLVSCNLQGNAAANRGEDLFDDSVLISAVNTISHLMIKAQVNSSETTYYVNGSCGDDSWTGLSQNCLGPDGPKKTIQNAIDNASDGDTVIVYPETYFENININGKNIIVSGTDPNSPATVADTIINGGGDGPVATFAGPRRRMSNYRFDNNKRSSGLAACGKRYLWKH